MGRAALESITRKLVDRFGLCIGEAASTVDVPAESCLLDNPALLDLPWVTMASSRLGDDPRLHRDVCRFVSHCLLECRSRGAVLFIATGSAIEPWACRAAELFDVSVVRIQVGDSAPKVSPDVVIESTLSRDEVVVRVGDRVDAVYVRRRGNIAHCLRERIRQRGDASTRVAITRLPKCDGKELVAEGAVGWLDTSWIGESNSQPVASKQEIVPCADVHWIHSDDQWLVHCTRGCQGPWPGETDHQYQDSLLLGTDSPQRQSVDTVTRILRSRKLIASAIASAKQWPVVCFSAASLADLLLSRCYRPHLRRWDYEPYGIAIRRSAAADLGIQSVIYGEASSRNQLNREDQFRFQSAGKTYDWTSEREWRSPGDVHLDQLNPNDVRVFVASSADAESIEGLCDWRIDAVLEPARNDVQSV